MKTIVGLLFLLFANIACGQTIECNQLCRGKQSKIPEDICIPQGHHIRDIFNKGDVNKDGLNDFIVSHSKVMATDGDTIFVSVYYAVSDGSFILKKAYNNLYPIIFRDYGYSDYNMSLPDALKSILALYHGNYPLIGIEFLSGEICLKVGQEIEYRILHFIYNKEKDNWYLARSDFMLEIDDYKETSSTEYSEEEQISIDEFNYLDWL